MGLWMSLCLGVGIFLFPFFFVHWHPYIPLHFIEIIFPLVFIIIIFSSWISKPAISLPEQASALIFSPNVSRVDGGVHGHQAIVFLSPSIPTVDRGAVHGQTLNDAITCACTRAYKGALSACACACVKCTCARGAKIVVCPAQNEKWVEQVEKSNEGGCRAVTSWKRKEQDAYTKTQSHS